MSGAHSVDNSCNKERMIEDQFGSKRKVNPNEITKPISNDFVDWMKKVNQQIDEFGSYLKHNLSPAEDLNHLGINTWLSVYLGDYFDAKEYSYGKDYGLKS